MYFLNFQPNDMLKLNLGFNESRPIYAYEKERKITFIFV